MNKDATRIMGAFLMGGLIGAAIALLYAPKSGRETRKDISKAAKRAKKGAVDLVEDITESVSDFTSDMKDKAADIIDRGKELSDNARKDILATLEQGQKVIEKQRKRIIDALGL
ncbi:MAG: YtxH domain-containing protein [Nitrospirota bacterium]